MTIYQALILGIIQGITEFLPISSSGHLALAKMLFELETTSLTFEAIVHLATLIAIAIYFRKELVNLTVPKMKLIAITALPALLIGYLVKDVIDDIFNSQAFVGIGLVITSLMLFIANHRLLHPKIKSQLDSKNALIIGLFQATAILPGISRSGSTLSGGLVMNIDRETAYNHSFIVGLVVILAAVAYQLMQLPINQIITTPNLVGFTASLITGMASLGIFKLVLKKARLHYFAFYCLVIGVFTLGLTLMS